MPSSVPFEKYLGIQVLVRENGFARLSLGYQPILTNPYGIMHGGAIASLADSAMAAAISSQYPHGLFYTTKLEVKFKAPVKGGMILAEARLLERKKNFLLGEVVILSENNQIIARVKATFFLIEEQKPVTGTEESVPR